MPPPPAKDDNPLKPWIRALDRTAPFGRGEGVTLPAHVAGMAERFGDRPALLSDGEQLSYRDLADKTHRYARWTLQQPVAAGEVVCLLLPNCPDYVAIWLGISSVGGIVALINPNLTGDALLHVIATAAPKQVIVGAALEAAVAEIQDRLPGAPTIWTHGAGEQWPRIDAAVETLSAEPLRTEEQRPPALSDIALYIYTSGTTGLPKAARVSHRRVAEWSFWFAGMIDTQPDDRMYNCLPLYHSVGGVVAVGAMLVCGGSVLIRPKFSASRFWDEVVDGECTLFQYIGELCRYLVNGPPNPRETQHRLRLCCGNGLRGDVWEAFQQRFRIPRILEFYASTEGNVSLYNCQGRPGAIGHVPAFLAHRFPIALVRCDPLTGELLRGEDGLCIRCGRDEVGEALGKVGQASSAHGRPFEGYTSDAASDAKLVRNVLAAGDEWFRTGDLMRRDGAGYYYFVDRIGDTFRWKGENVATEDVAETLRACPGVTDAVVYGVTVPGTEGRAGMTTLTVEPGFDLAAFHRHARERLPDYARPLFVRIGDSITATGTFKPAKALLAREGYDPDAIRDPLYFDDRAGGGLVPLDQALWERLRSGQVRV
ncbi:MAG TPA: long-chain-acyl-CoA synthetase [Rhodopila sp.]|uniref:long-chain-acyl-CoA synthetase n=1 Tax=Rhodopila sp. TaxID=2480087 RepID=UPI002B839400|nr:long-chain-acyl-CoA synthetase [Rhodopila sp.]HVY14532.1 long-chain-acyl-CoA synthetase [Rhodopila sp.]